MKPQFYRKVLKNGFTVLFEKRELPIVSVAFAVRNGGINEDVDEKGISHYIEHMLYKGTPTRNAKQIAEQIERNGGELNGFTEEMITAYWCKIPSKKLDISLDVLSDRVLNPLFDEKEMEKERKVIYEEIKMRRDTPRVYVMDEIQKFLYKGTLALPLIGTHETMNSINKKKIEEKFKKVYTPNNMMLCVVGDAEFKDIVEFAEKTFGNEKGSVPKFKIELKNGEKVEERKGIDQANLVYSYHIPLSRDKKSYAAYVLNVLMAGGMSSRLFSEIREKRNLAYSVKGDVALNKDFAYAIIYVGTTKENVQTVRKLIVEEFEKVADDLEEKELKEVKDQIIGNYQIGMEDSQMQMVNLLFHEVDGNVEEFYEFEEKIRAVKLEDVKEIAKKAKEKYSFFALVPED